MALSCTVIRDLLPLYAEDLLQEESRLLVDEHLASCEACQKELEVLREPAPPQAETLPLFSVSRMAAISPAESSPQARFCFRSSFLTENRLCPFSRIRLAF